MLFFLGRFACLWLLLVFCCFGVFCFVLLLLFLGGVVFVCFFFGGGGIGILSFFLPGKGEGKNKGKESEGCRRGRGSSKKLSMKLHHDRPSH